MALDPVLHAEMMQLLAREKELRDKKLPPVEQELTLLLPKYEELKRDFELLHREVTRLSGLKTAFTEELGDLEKKKAELRMKQRLAEVGGAQRTNQANQLVEQFAERGIKPDPTADQVKAVDLNAQLEALKKKMVDD